MRTLRKILLFAAAAGVAIVAMLAVHPPTTPSLVFLASCGLFGLFWLYFGHSSNSGGEFIYVALTLLGVAAGTGIALIL